MKTSATIAELAIDEAQATLTAGLATFPDTHRYRIVAHVLALQDVRDEITGPRVSYFRCGTEAIKGVHLKARSTRDVVVILADDGRVHSRPTHGAVIRPLEEGE